MINYVCYLPSIGKFETLTIQKYKKCFLLHGREIVILIIQGREKVIWAGGRRKGNRDGGRGLAVG